MLQFEGQVLCIPFISLHDDPDNFQKPESTFTDFSGGTPVIFHVYDAGGKINDLIGYVGTTICLFTLINIVCGQLQVIRKKHNIYINAELG